MTRGEKIIQALTEGKLRISKDFRIATLTTILQRQGLLARSEDLDEILATGEGGPTGRSLPEPMKSFETWFLGRVAQSVDAGKVAANLLMKLQAEFAAARATSQEASRSIAIRDIAEIAGIDQKRAAETLAAIEAQPTVAQEKLMRRIAETWLEGQREGHRSRGSGWRSRG